MTPHQPAGNGADPSSISFDDYYPAQKAYYEGLEAG